MIKVQWDSNCLAFKTQLELLVAGLTQEADKILTESAESAMSAIKERYPVRTGKLRDGVEIERPRGSVGFLTPGVHLVNRARHAYIFELGTQARHTAIGANRGSMPAGHVFVPIAEERRRQAIDLIKAALLAHGAASVHGEVESAVA